MTGKRMTLAESLDAHKLFQDTSDQQKLNALKEQQRWLQTRQQATKKLDHH